MATDEAASLFNASLPKSSSVRINLFSIPLFLSLEKFYAIIESNL
jgi:hypothetical protein